MHRRRSLNPRIRFTCASRLYRLTGVTGPLSNSSDGDLSPPPLFVQDINNKAVLFLFLLTPKMSYGNVHRSGRNHPTQRDVVGWARVYLSLSGRGVVVRSDDWWSSNISSNGKKYELYMNI